MNRKLLDYVWNDNAELNGSKLLVMLCIALHTEDDGICRISVSKLAVRARISERQAQRIVQKLEREGYLAVERINGRSSEYIIVNAAGHSEVEK